MFESKIIQFNCEASNDDAEIFLPEQVMFGTHESLLFMSREASREHSKQLFCLVMTADAVIPVIVAKEDIFDRKICFFFSDGGKHGLGVIIIDRHDDYLSIRSDHKH